MNNIVITFINGQFSEKLSDISLLPKEIGWGIDTFSLHVPKNFTLSTPIRLLFLNTEKNNFISSPHHVLVAEENSCITLIEEHTADVAEHYSTKITTDMHVKNRAVFNYYKIQKESFTATHTAKLRIEQEKDSCVNAFFLDCGSRSAYEEVNVRLNQKGAECHLRGLYSLQHDNQQINHHVHVDHLAAQGMSSMEYKGILDKKSHAEFRGKVWVHPAAQKISAHQENHNLLLSAAATVSTKPELEIYADDVKCTHGATVGQLDTDSLFYLRARGIEKEVALKLLTSAFAAEIMNKIAQPYIKQYMQQRVSYYEEH